VNPLRTLVDRTNVNISNNDTNSRISTLRWHSRLSACHAIKAGRLSLFPVVHTDDLKYVRYTRPAQPCARRGLVPGQGSRTVLPMTYHESSIHSESSCVHRWKQAELMPLTTRQTLKEVLKRVYWRQTWILIVIFKSSRATCNLFSNEPFLCFSGIWHNHE